MDIATQPDDAQQLTQSDAETSVPASAPAFVSSSVAAIRAVTASDPCMPSAWASPGAMNADKTKATTKHEISRANPNGGAVAGRGLTVARVAQAKDLADGLIRTCLALQEAPPRRRTTMSLLTSRAPILPQAHHRAGTRPWVSRSPRQPSGTDRSVSRQGCRTSHSPRTRWPWATHAFFQSKRLISLDAPATRRVMLTGVSPRVRQNQPWLPVKAAVSSPVASGTARPFS